MLFAICQIGAIIHVLLVIFAGASFAPLLGWIMPAIISGAVMEFCIPSSD